MVVNNKLKKFGKIIEKGHGSAIDSRETAEFSVKKNNCHLLPGSM
jgi:hypothetical protein